MAATNVPEAERNANSGTVDVLATNLAAAKESRMAAMDAAAEKTRMEMAAAGKALHGALGSNPLGLIASGAIGASGLTIATTDTTDTDPVLEAGESAGALGDWKGMNYADMAANGVTNAAVVYTNQAAPKMTAFGDVYTTGYTAATRTLAFSGRAADPKIRGSMFPTTGTLTYETTAPGGEDVSFSGMYDGVSGTYVCNTGGTAGGCQATYMADGISLTAGTWTFQHAPGAMIPVADADYLYFGWWLTKDKDGVPTAASAFSGTAGTAPAVLTGVTAIAGSATYSGKAAGKFAINNPLGGSDAGHFTADASLTAKFGGTGAGVTGMIDNFMANGPVGAMERGVEQQHVGQRRRRRRFCD